jgi:hypothetical protein
VKLSVTVDVPMTLEQLAGLFVELDDDSQAKFFVEVARLMGTWTAHERNMQEFYIGRHLRDCSCSTEDARDFLRNIVDSMATESP